MPVQDNFVQAFRAGAEVGNMIALRRLREQELRAQEAHKQIEDRQLQAQAQMLMEHANYYRAQAAKAKQEQADEEAITQAVKDQYRMSFSRTGDPVKAAKESFAITAAAFPQYAQKLTQSGENLARMESLGSEGKDFPPSAVLVPHPKAGEPPIPVLRTGPKTAQMIEGKEPFDKTKWLVEKLQEAQAAGNEALAQGYQNELAKNLPRGMTMKQDANGNWEITEGPIKPGQGGELTTANMSKVQEGQAQAINTIDIANRLESLINSETVGVRAFAESWVKDKVLAQWAPELASKERASAEVVASRLRSSATRELRSDSNISEAERKQILAAVPTINDPINSPANARNQVRNIRMLSAIHALVAAKRMKTPVPKAAAMALDDETLAALAEEGLITNEQAKEAWQLKRAK